MNNTVQATIDAASPVWSRNSIRAMDLGTFLAHSIPPREDILSPVLQSQSLAMIFAQRGVGKTHFALNIGYAIASGGEFLGYKAPKPRRVLYIDGEMPARVMQERLASIVNASPTEASADYFQLITPDLQPHGMPDLATADGQEGFRPYTDVADVIIVDNISTLVRSGKENEAEGWLPIQDWALQLRTQGKSVIFIHHAGKNGGQRGTSRREDVLDLVIELKQPNDYEADQGARFEIHYTKARHLFGTSAEPLEVSLKDGIWTFQKFRDQEKERVLVLKEQGLKIREIAEELGISKSKVGRIIRLS